MVSTTHMVTYILLSFPWSMFDKVDILLVSQRNMSWFLRLLELNGSMF